MSIHFFSPLYPSTWSIFCKIMYTLNLFLDYEWVYMDVCLYECRRKEVDEKVFFFHFSYFCCYFCWAIVMFTHQTNKPRWIYMIFFSRLTFFFFLFIFISQRKSGKKKVMRFIFQQILIFSIKSHHEWENIEIRTTNRNFNQCKVCRKPGRNNKNINNCQ